MGRGKARSSRALPKPIIFSRRKMMGFAKKAREERAFFALPILRKLLQRNTMPIRLNLILVGFVALVHPAQAQTAADFYRGRTISLIVGYPPGGANDIYARLAARHIGKHIPGTPNVVTRNMPGAGSLLAA